MWRDFILEHDPGAELYEPAAREQLIEIEDHFQVILPEDYISLMLETNGILASGYTKLVYNIDDVVERNNFYRTDETILSTYMTLDSLFFFGSPQVDGLQYGFSVVQKQIQDHIFIWDPMEDTRTRISLSLKSFIERWYKGA